MEVRIGEAEKSKSTTGQQTDLILFGEAIQRGGEVFDSCPAYLDLQSGLKAVQLAVPNLILRLFIQAMFILLTLVQWATISFSGGKARPVEHWDHFESSNIANRQAYIYSTVDVATDPKKLEELIENRKQRTDATVFVKKFNDSQHCAHLVKHTKDYQTFLDAFFASISEQQKESEILDQDPDMTDYQLEMD